MAFELPDLPYSKDSFGDLISSKTFDFHHGKHHQAYVTKTNDAIEGGDLAGSSLSEVILAAKENGNQGLFNNSAQIWNHSFYWKCLSPDKQNPSGSLAARIEDCFGSKSEMLSTLKNEAVGHFASGWAWLILDGDKLEVTSLHDADTPVAHDGMLPLLTIDVWEHAYYLDFQNDRGAYVDALLEHVNWEFVAQNMDGKGVSRADQG
ncbi:superoxide dismutase [Parasphingopyxis sp.]|uniref:superoxide dismutase n=1 Tax=Parasphingopyxis sp. TaxID=1920299 RepID=UPI00260F499C|nr:superoxide dismutase [Parasphingopyxis sp.]